jgi:hypothetical protein
LVIASTICHTASMPLLTSAGGWSSSGESCHTIDNAGNEPACASLMMSADRAMFGEP